MSMRLRATGMKSLTKSTRQTQSAARDGQTEIDALRLSRNATVRGKRLPQRRIEPASGIAVHARRRPQSSTGLAAHWRIRRTARE